MTGMMDMMRDRLDVVTVRLAAQGPLGATYFQGIEYDVDADGFKPTTVRQLIPTFEAIFAAAPADPGEAADYLDVGEPTIYRWMDDRTLGYVRDEMSGRTFVVRRDIESLRQDVAQQDLSGQDVEETAVDA